MPTRRPSRPRAQAGAPRQSGAPAQSSIENTADPDPTPSSKTGPNPTCQCLQYKQRRCHQAHRANLHSGSRIIQPETRPIGPTDASRHPPGPAPSFCRPFQKPLWPSAGEEHSSFRASELPSFRASELPSFRASELPSFRASEAAKRHRLERQVAKRRRPQSSCPNDAMPSFGIWLINPADPAAVAWQRGVTGRRDWSRPNRTVRCDSPVRDPWNAETSQGSDSRRLFAAQPRGFCRKRRRYPRRSAAYRHPTHRLAAEIWRFSNFAAASKFRRILRRSGDGKASYAPLSPGSQGTILRIAIDGCWVGAYNPAQERGRHRCRRTENSSLSFVIWVLDGLSSDD